MKLPHYWLMPMYKKSITPELIIICVAEHFNTSTEFARIKYRGRMAINQRFMAMSLIKEHCHKLSLNAIGRYFGSKDHASVIHAIRKHRDYKETDYEYRNNFLAIKTRLEL